MAASRLRMAWGLGLLAYLAGDLFFILTPFVIPFVGAVVLLACVSATGAPGKARLSELVDRAAGGEEVIIARAGTPVARLVALKPRRRVPGNWKGKVRISDDFDAPLSGKELREFLDGDI